MGYRSVLHLLVRVMGMELAYVRLALRKWPVRTILWKKSLGIIIQKAVFKKNIRIIMESEYSEQISDYKNRIEKLRSYL